MTITRATLCRGVTGNPSVAASVVALLKNISDAIGHVPAQEVETRKQLDELAASIGGNDVALADAVVANTMMGSVKMVPVEEEAVEEDEEDEEDEEEPVVVARPVANPEPVSLERV